MANIKGGSTINGLPILAKSGSNYYLPKFGNNNVLSNSQIYDNGTGIGIGNINPNERLEVVGNVKANIFISTVATGNVPFVVTSNTLVPNLNSQYLNGKLDTNFANAVHTHTATDITQDSGNRFVSDTQITAWNGKSIVASSTTNGNILLNGNEQSVYTHPTSDGNLHVPATGTINNNKVLKAGSTAGTFAWGSIDFSELTGTPTLNYLPNNADGTTSGSLTINGGSLTLGNATSNTIKFSNGGNGVPNGTNNSTGLKISLYAGANTSYGIGLESSTVWYSSYNNHKWYSQNNVSGAAPTSVMTLDGSGNLNTRTFISNVAQGTAPLSVTSTTLVSNLNADTVDGKHATDFVSKDVEIYVWMGI